MKKQIILVLGLITHLSAFAGPGDIGSVGTLIKGTSTGFKCQVIRGSLKLSGDEAKRRFSDMKAVNVFNHTELMSGQLKSNPQGSLIFDSVNSVIGIANKSIVDVLYSTVQNTVVNNSSGQQIIDENNLTGQFTVVYTHKFKQTSAAKEVQELTVITRDTQSADSAKTAKSEISYTYTSANNPGLNSSMTADLDCSEE